jgi:competence protein ComEA
MKPAALIASLLVTAIGLLAQPLTALAGPVNINTADAKTLARELTGIGLSRAQAIVEYRQKNGPFHTADDLANVKGIGKQMVEKNRANIRVDKAKGAEGAAPASAEP